MARGHNGRQVFMYAVCYFCQILTELQISPQILIKLGENPFNGSGSCCLLPDVRIDLAKLVVPLRMRTCLKRQEVTTC
jgi:hypothetical protein